MLTAAMALTLIACGGEREAVVARVRGEPITSGQVVHWTTLLAGEQVPDAPRYAACVKRREAVSLQPVRSVLRQECAREYRSLEHRALEALISMRWMIAEARQEGVGPSGAELAQRLRVHKPPFPGVAGTAGDYALRARAQVAGEKLERRWVLAATPVTRAEVSRYYATHLAQFEEPERRDIAIVEHLPSETTARRLLAQAQRRRDLSSLGALHESFDRRSVAGRLRSREGIYLQIFAARAHALVGPLLLNGLYSFFAVTAIKRRVVHSIARVEARIAGALTQAHRGAALAARIEEWRRTWLARTSCSAGYTVQKCSGYRGPRSPEGSLSVSKNGY